MARKLTTTPSRPSSGVNSCVNGVNRSRDSSARVSDMRWRTDSASSRTW